MKLIAWDYWGLIPGEDAPRWVHRVYAFVRGFYWLPCPGCGNYMGGHEPHGRWMLFTHIGGGRTLCRREACQKLGQESYERLRPEMDAHYSRVFAVMKDQA